MTTMQDNSIRGGQSCTGVGLFILADCAVRVCAVVNTRSTGNDGPSPWDASDVAHSQCCWAVTSAECAFEHIQVEQPSVHCRYDGLMVAPFNQTRGRRESRMA